MKRKFVLLSAAMLALSMAFTGCGKSSDKEYTAELISKEEAEKSDAEKSDAEKEEAEKSDEAKADDTAAAEEPDEAETSAAEEARNKFADTLIQLEGPQAGDTVATLHTNKGDISVRFFPQYAPKAVENFVTHAKEGYYDGVTFHRVINNFMIQGGDPEGTGRGGESIWGKEFENEVTWNLRSFRGSLCMANAGPDTNGSQFYIVQNPDIGDDFKSQLEQVRTMKDEVYAESDELGTVTYGDIFPDAVIDEYINNGGYPSLDMGYTIFGQVYEGMDVVDAIAAVDTDSSDKPIDDVIIESIDVSTYQ